MKGAEYEYERLANSVFVLGIVSSDRGSCLIMSWGESSRCRMLQHASSPEPDVVTTLRRCYVNYTGFCSAASGVQNSPVWCARQCAVSNAYLPGWWHPSRLRRQPTIPSVFLW